ncbi:hypothetical protein B0H34DRAFT_657146 [Crassisporium funariophilum]|nr:hypothetical protein B0H34DRAFT_657146 [Crassisporium funariophilum]
MPAELPGLYWDEARNRYFPISSRPKKTLPAAATIANTYRNDSGATATESLLSNTNVKRQRKHALWHLHETRRSTECYTQRLRASHEILCSHYASTSRLSHMDLPTLGYIQAFCSTTLGGRTWRFLGDSEGWLYSDKDFLSQDRDGVHCWEADATMQPDSPISSISVSGPLCVSTCLGTGKFVVQNLAKEGRMYLMNMNGVSDIRTSHLQGTALVVGANKKAIHMSDVDVINSVQHLYTNSDVFAVTQQKHLVFTGSRNGSVDRFDMRMPKHRSQKLFDNRFGDRPRSSVYHLDFIGESELLMSHLNGDLVTFDMRYAPTTSTSSPVRVYEGHVNTYTDNLGIAIDHEQDFLFAAGQDRRVRCWSLRTGALLSPPAVLKPEPSVASPYISPTVADTNPFSMTFPEYVRALQVTEEGGSAGTSLWAVCDKELYQYHLGQRAGKNNGLSA